MESTQTLSSFNLALNEMVGKERNTAASLLTSYLHKLQFDGHVRMAGEDENARDKGRGVTAVALSDGWAVRFDDGDRLVSLLIGREGVRVVRPVAHEGGYLLDDLQPEDVPMVKELLHSLSSLDSELVVAGRM